MMIIKGGKREKTEKCEKREKRKERGCDEVELKRVRTDDVIRFS